MHVGMCGQQAPSSTRRKRVGVKPAMRLWSQRCHTAIRLVLLVGTWRAVTQPSSQGCLWALGVLPHSHVLCAVCEHLVRPLGLEQGTSGAHAPLASLLAGTGAAAAMHLGTVHLGVMAGNVGAALNLRQLLGRCMLLHGGGDACGQRSAMRRAQG